MACDNDDCGDSVFSSVSATGAHNLLNNHWGDDRLDILCIASLTVTLTWGDDRLDMSSISPPGDTFKTHINIPLFGSCFPVACYSSRTRWASTSNTPPCPGWRLSSFVQLLCAIRASGLVNRSATLKRFDI